ncbi:MAG: DUF58 domain-containing protein [Acidobacteriota bacterium]|nr:DUF58 domain-containing protein [Acidobacteriota bacterium]
MKDHRLYADLKKLTAMQFMATGFSFLPRQPVHSILSGRHASRLRGRGLDFEELRHYRAGDDIRTMDWKVTNRTGKPHIRVFTEERERPVLLVVDQRIGMFFGSRHKMKSVIAAELTALAGWRVLSVGDRVGAVVFNDTENAQVRPQRSRKNLMQILHHVLRFNHKLSSGMGTPQPQALNRALSEVERLAGHDYLIVLISDLDGWNEETVARLKRLGRHNDVMAGLVYDPLEQDLPSAGRVVVSDGAMQIEVDTRQKDLKQDFSRQFTDTVTFLVGELKKYGIPVIPLETLTPVQDQVRQAIGEHRAAR